MNLEPAVSSPPLSAVSHAGFRMISTTPVGLLSFSGRSEIAELDLPETARIEDGYQGKLVLSLKEDWILCVTLKPYRLN